MTVIRKNYSYNSFNERIAVIKSTHYFVAFEIFSYTKKNMKPLFYKTFVTIIVFNDGFGLIQRKGFLFTIFTILW